MKIDQKYLWVIGYEGLVVLVVQIMASLVLTPLLGNTFSFWALNILSTMMAMSLGYYGSKFVIQRTTQHFNKTILIILLTGVLLLYGLFFFSESLLLTIVFSISNPIVALMITLVLYNFLPIAVFSFLPPIVIKMVAHSGENTGQYTGMIYGFSSIIATLSALVYALFIIPGFDVYVIALITINLGIVVMLIFNQKSTVFKYGFLWLSLALILNLVYIKKEYANVDKHNKGWKLLKEDNGLLGELKVLEDLNTKSRYLLINNVSQTKAHVTGRSLYPYVYSMAIYSTLKPAKSNVLLAGFGGGNLIYELVNQDFNVDVVDIDERLPEVSEKYFLVPKDQYHFFHSDIRRYVKKTTKKYDVIILDLSFGESVPTNVYTKECFEEIKLLLNPEGIVLVHFLTSLDDNGLHSLASIGKTIKSAQLDYKIMNRDNRNTSIEEMVGEEDNVNVIICASEKVDFSHAFFRIDPGIPKDLIPRKNNFYTSFDDAGGIVFTDDKSSIDLLQINSTYNLRKENIEWLKRRLLLNEQ